MGTSRISLQVLGKNINIKSRRVNNYLKIACYSLIGLDNKKLNKKKLKIEDIVKDRKNKLFIRRYYDDDFFLA